MRSYKKPGYFCGRSLATAKSPVIDRACFIHRTEQQNTWHPDLNHPDITRHVLHDSTTNGFTISSTIYWAKPFQHPCSLPPQWSFTGRRLCVYTCVFVFTDRLTSWWLQWVLWPPPPSSLRSLILSLCSGLWAERRHTLRLFLLFLCAVIHLLGSLSKLHH